MQIQNKISSISWFQITALTFLWWADTFVFQKNIIYNNSWFHCYDLGIDDAQRVKIDICFYEDYTS